MTVPKAGWKTTEFWTTAVVLVLTTLVATGVLSSEQSQDIEGPVTRMVMGLAAILTDGLMVWRYIGARTALKAPPEGEGAG